MGEPGVPRGTAALSPFRKGLEQIEQQSATLQRIAKGLDEFVRDQEGRLAELEQELNDTAMLYVASEQFHAALDPKQILKYVRELLEQLMGAEVFALYLRSGSGNSFVAVASRGVSDSELAQGPPRDGPFDSVIASGRPIIVQGRPLPSGTLSNPIAAVPIMVEERPIGALLLAKLFAHKEGWGQNDQQLLQLLSLRTGPALLAAHLIRRQSDLQGTLAGLGESLK